MAQHAKRIPASSRALFASVLTLALAVGCGGGGGGGGEPLSETPIVADDALFQGNYAHTGAGGSDALSQWQAEWGEHTADGAGAFDFVPEINQNGRRLPVSMPLPPELDAYEVAADRSVLWRGPAPASESKGRGAISPDGRLLTLLASAPAQPMIHLLARTSGPARVDQLNGEYYLGVFGAQAASGRAFAQWGELTADGLGAMALTLSGNLAEVLFGPISETGTYETRPGLSQLLLTFGSSVFSGHVDETGDLLVAGGAITDGDDPAAFVLLRKTAGATAALLSGDYACVGIIAAAGGYFAVRGRIESDGIGTATLVLDDFNREGVGPTPGATDSTPGPYTIEPNGGLSWRLSDTPFFGAVVADGSYGFLAGGAQDGSPPAFFFFHR